MNQRVRRRTSGGTARKLLAAAVSALVLASTLGSAGASGAAAAAEDSGTIRGTITADSTGVPLAGVSVFVGAASGDEFGPVLTDANGFYSISGIPVLDAEGTDPATYLVFASAPALGYFHRNSSYLNVTAAGPTVFDFKLSHASTLSGVVQNVDAEPIAGAKVFNANAGETDPVQEATSSADGSFTMAIAYGRVILTVQAAGYDPVNPILDDVPTDSEIVGQVYTLNRTHGSTASGTITSESTGDPLEGIAVYTAGADGSATAQTLTDADGVYHLNPVPVGAYTLHVFDPTRKYLPVDIDTIGVANQDIVVDTQLKLDGPATIVGTVVNELTGEPLLGEMVDLIGSSDDYSVTGRTTSDMNGHYSFTGLLTYDSSNNDVRYTLIVPESPADDPLFAANVGGIVPLGASTTVVDLPREPKSSISGTVLDDLGVPVAGAVVAAASTDQSQVPYTDATATTDADGRYTLDDVHFRDNTIRVTAPGFDQLERVVPVPLGSTLTGIDFTLLDTPTPSATPTPSPTPTGTPSAPSSPTTPATPATSSDPPPGTAFTPASRGASLADTGVTVAPTLSVAAALVLLGIAFAFIRTATRRRPR